MCTWCDVTFLSVEHKDPFIGQPGHADNSHCIGDLSRPAPYGVLLGQCSCGCVHGRPPELRVGILHPLLPLYLSILHTYILSIIALQHVFYLSLRLESWRGFSSTSVRKSQFLLVKRLARRRNRTRERPEGKCVHGKYVAPGPLGQLIDVAEAVCWGKSLCF